MKLINSSSAKLFIFVFINFLLSSISAYAAQQPEYILDEQPVSKSVVENNGSLAKAFDKKKHTRKPIFPEFRKELDNLPPFWRDSQLKTNFRTYYFDRHSEQPLKSQAWAYGGSLKYNSGWWKNFLQIGATIYTSQKIVGSEDKDGTLLLKPGQHGFVALGEAYIRGKLTDNLELKLFRQTLNLPYLNKQDSRMAPNTFEAYMLSQANTPLQWTTGYVRKMKARNSNDFEYMAEVAGITETQDKGLALLGAHYSLTEHTNIAAISYFTQDYMNTFYSEANHVLFPKKKIPVSLSLQYTNQQSAGKEIRGSFDSYSFGGKVSLSYQNMILTAAATATGKNNSIQKPFGGTPSYLSLMVKDFDRAGENAWLMGLSYRFDSLGLDGLSIYSNYAYGNTPDSGSNDSPDQSEWDVTIDFKPKDPPLNGLWLRLRRATINQDSGGNDMVDYRVILNYEVKI